MSVLYASETELATTERVCVLASQVREDDTYLKL